MTEPLSDELLDMWERAARDEPVVAFFPDEVVAALCAEIRRLRAELDVRRVDATSFADMHSLCGRALDALLLEYDSLGPDHQAVPPVIFDLGAAVGRDARAEMEQAAREQDAWARGDDLADPAGDPPCP